MAAEFAGEIRSVQPQGPYRLAGFCLGAYLAFETACQLQAQGEEVSCLFIINTPGDWRQVTSWVDSVRYHAGILRGLAPREIPRYLLERLSYRWNRITDSLLRELVLMGEPGSVNRLPTWISVRLLRDAHVRAGRQYRPGRRFRGRLIYVAGSGDAMRDPFAYWRELVEGEILICQAPGRSREVLEEPHVATLASILEKFLGEPA
jgi:thioesterase domain-containing protein